MQSQTKRRLDDLIREGAEKTKPTTGEYIFSEPDGEIYACAVGAAEHAISGKENYVGWLTRSLNTVLRQKRIPFTDWPDEAKQCLSESKVEIMRVIVEANDNGMSREAIAEWVGWLIDAQGYDLYVEMEQELTNSCDNDNSTEEEKRCVEAGQ